MGSWVARFSYLLLMKSLIMPYVILQKDLHGDIYIVWYSWIFFKMFLFIK